MCSSDLLRAEVRVNGMALHGLPVAERRLGYVPQNLALFPHLNVRDNVAFGLRCARVPDAEARTTAVLIEFGLANLDLA